MTTVTELLAMELGEATATRRPVRPISDRFTGFDIADAYAVQRRTRAAALSAGARLIGYKIGATSVAIQRAFNITTPDFGFVTDAMCLPDRSHLLLGNLIQPLVEGELAFLLSRDLAGEATTLDDVRNAVTLAFPVLEVLDSRVHDWRITIVDTVADNASCARVVLGAPAPMTQVPLSSMQMVLRCGETQEVGLGKAVLGDPLLAVVWLARTLASFGECLRAGHVVLAGAWAAPVKPIAGVPIEASFEGVGSVIVTPQAAPYCPTD